MDVTQERMSRLGTPGQRTIALLATFALAGVVLIWGVAAEESGFRPTTPAAVVVALAIVAGALSSPARKTASLMAAAGLAGGAVLLAVPAGEHCELPVAEFGPHLVEDAAGPHEHDRCQLASDRRSLAGIAVAAGAGAAIPLLVRRRRSAKQRSFMME